MLAAASGISAPIAADDLYKAEYANQALKKVPRHIRSLENLRSLDISGNMLVCIEPLYMLRGLRNLDVSRNRLRIFNAGSAFRYLETLNCAGNQICAVQMQGCQLLRAADFSNNQLSALSGFYGCASLGMLRVENNILSDVFQLIYLKQCPLREFCVAGNGIAFDSDTISRILPGCELISGLDTKVSQLEPHCVLRKTDKELKALDMRQIMATDASGDSRQCFCNACGSILPLHKGAQGISSPRFDFSDQKACDSEGQASLLKIVDFVRTETAPKSVVRTTSYEMRAVVKSQENCAAQASSLLNQGMNNSSTSLSILRQCSLDQLKSFDAKVPGLDLTAVKTQETKSEDDQPDSTCNMMNSSVINQPNAKQCGTCVRIHSETPPAPTTAKENDTKPPTMRQDTRRSASQESTRRSSFVGNKSANIQNTSNASSAQQKSQNSDTAVRSGKNEPQTESSGDWELEIQTPAANDNIKEYPTAVYTPADPSGINPFKKLVPDIPLAKLNDYYQPSSPNVSARLYGKQLLSLSDSESGELAITKTELPQPYLEINSSIHASENMTDDFAKRSQRQNTMIDKSQVASGRSNTDKIQIPMASDSIGNILCQNTPQDNGDDMQTAPKIPPLQPAKPNDIVQQQRRSFSNQSDSRQWRQGQNAILASTEIVEKGGQQFRKIVKKKRPQKSVFKQ